MDVLNTLNELDEKLRDCQSALAVSDDAFRRVFNSFRLDIAAQLPSDPFSPAYAAAQMALYETIAGRRYETGNEASVFDPQVALGRAFPFTASPAVGGAHLGAIAFLVSGLALKPGARVLDVGPGWGNTTLALAQFGFDVTALDIEPRFCALVEARARQIGASVRVVNDDFFWIEREARGFDAIVFFESFHHCADHNRLLRALAAALAPGGHVYFGAEPITRDFPVPWGIRTDGESLWAIRQNGWLELGFRESYFRTALRRAGLRSSIRRSLDLPWIHVWDATAGGAEPLVIAAFDSRLQSLAGVRQDAAIVLEGQEGYGLYGPYVALEGGHYRAIIAFSGQGEIAGHAVFEIASGVGTRLLAQMEVDLNALGGGTRSVSLDFVLEDACTDLEARLYCREGCLGAIERVEIHEA